MEETFKERPNKKPKWKGNQKYVMPFKICYKQSNLYLVQEKDQMYFVGK